MYIDELSVWQNTLPEQRGEDYKAFKMEKARQLLEFIKSHGIDFTDHIETMYTTTPLSYETLRVLVTVLPMELSKITNVRKSVLFPPEPNWGTYFSQDKI